MDLLVALVSHVRTDDNMFDQVLDLLGDRLVVDEKVRQALEVVNPDAVWLSLYQRSMVDWRPVPELDKVGFAPMAAPSRSWYVPGQSAVPFGL